MMSSVVCLAVTWIATRTPRIPRRRCSGGSRRPLPLREDRDDGKYQFEKEQIFQGSRLPSQSRIDLAPPGYSCSPSLSTSIPFG
jgi:hypothetical protein